MMKSVAQEVAPWRLRVDSIAPGAIRTPIDMEAWDTPEHYSQLLKLIPYKQIGEPREIGRATAWLASDDSDYVHGITLFVDGGMTLCPGFETGGSEKTPPTITGVAPLVSKRLKTPDGVASLLRPAGRRRCRRNSHYIREACWYRNFLTLRNRDADWITSKIWPRQAYSNGKSQRGTCGFDSFL